MISVLNSSFGELLKAFRKRQRLTQEALAGKIGVHRNTISIWERGDYLPESKTVVLEVASQLHLNERETRQLLEASLTALATHWYLPHTRNLLFTGREEILQRLHQMVQANQAVVLTQSYALHGLGGIGKTQTVMEYAYRYAQEYAAVFWIGAESTENIISSFLSIIDVLELPERQESDQRRIVAAVQRWLTHHRHWLLIWDNVEDIGLLSSFLPSVRQGTMLFTTRRQTLGTLASGIELQPMTKEEGMLFLLHRARLVDLATSAEQMQQVAQQTPTEYTAAQELVEMMDGLPLALDQVGAYIEETPCSLTNYLTLYHTKRAKLLERRGDTAIDHPMSVATTWSLSFEKVEQANPAAAELLRLCSFLHAEAIPEEILTQGADYLGELLGPVAANTFLLDEAIRAISAYSLLHRNIEAQTLTIHRLVQAVLREGMSKQDQIMWIERGIGALNAVFPEVKHETWSQCERLISHALTCTDETVSQGVISPDLASLLFKMARYFHERVQYEQAIAFYQRAIAIHEQAWGAEYLGLIRPLNSLANVYFYQGRYEQAEPLFRRALHIGESALGPEHLDLANPLNNLALLYQHQDKYEEAEPLFLRALAIQKQAQGPEHPEVARPLSNLAALYAQQGCYEKAEPLFLQALSICEQALGSTHPNVAYPLSNLADFYYEQKRYNDAEPLVRRAISIWEQTLEPDHPKLTYPLVTLADIDRVLGKYEEAEQLYQRTLRMCEQGAGPNHPPTTMALFGLALLYTEQGKYEQAVPLHQQALAMREQYPGEFHPETAESLLALALLYERLGSEEQAEQLLQRACTIFEQHQEHPDTATARQAYQNLLERKSRAVQDFTEEQQKQTKRLQESSCQTSSPLSASSEIVLTPSQEIEKADPLAAFLAACCELHPRAWSRSSDLWHAYEGWVKEQQEKFPLSRSAFIEQLKTHGCRADRTNTTRLWRGIALMKKEA